MINYKDILNKQERISVIGLGYVGFPLLIELAKKYNVIGFDTNKEKIEAYKNGIDVTNEVGNEETKKTKAYLSSEEESLSKSRFHIVSVPTPINDDKTPNLIPIIAASKTIGRNLTKGSIVVYESTVYPGTTEEVCIPVLEEYSGLKFGIDFEVGYSPERINPGDKTNTITNITKVVSGSSNEALETIYNVYNGIITAGIHKATSIKVAEAAKVIENAQRDINIAFMNELSIVFNQMNIDTKEVLEAAGTKWNFLKFQPGLVGGHCIGVDPYYFTYKAEQLGYKSQIISAGRKVNDEMGKFVANNIVKQIILSDQKVKGSKVAIFGFTFKENVADVRNTKILDIINELKEFGIEVLIYDPIADEKDVEYQYGIKLVSINDLTDLSAIVYAVPHEVFEKFSINDFNQMYREKKVFIDVKGFYSRKTFEEKNYTYWSL